MSITCFAVSTYFTSLPSFLLAFLVNNCNTYIPWPGFFLYFIHCIFFRRNLFLILHTTHIEAYFVQNYGRLLILIFSGDMYYAMCIMQPATNTATSLAIPCNQCVSSGILSNCFPIRFPETQKPHYSIATLWIAYWKLLPSIGQYLLLLMRAGKPGSVRQ